MYVLLMRHGEAEKGSSAVDDRHRCLTPAGISQTRKAARLLKKCLGGRKIIIFASPLERTKQTAELTAEECGSEEIHTTEDLIGESWRPVETHVLAGEGPVLLVSHQPFLQAWLYRISGAAISFGKSAIAVVDYDRISGMGELIAYFTPHIRKLKKEES